jgi:hypothetical protein
MAKLFQRQNPVPVAAAVTHIPGEDEVDPDMLEQTAADPSSRQDYRDSNQDGRFGNRVTNVTSSVVPKEATELVRWAKDGRRHIALRVASTQKVVASWWDDHIDQALLAGDLDTGDMHTAAYTYAAKHNLLPAPVSPKSAALFNKIPALTFVSPLSPEWSGFVEKLRNLPNGSTIQTLDGYVLAKDGETFGDGDISFLLEDFTGAAQHLMPDMAIKRAADDKTFVGQQREDGSWSVQEVSKDVAERAAEEITDAPDGNKARVIEAENGDAARGQLHEDMKADGVTPAESTAFVNPSR